MSNLGNDKIPVLCVVASNETWKNIGVTPKCSGRKVTAMST